ncbi:MAG: hypothetical protein ACI4NA_05770 [Succinivibrio sp.]
MRKTIRLPANVYLKSRLNESGVRFTTNTVDTVCRKQLGVSFFLVAGLLCLLWLLMLAGRQDVFPGRYFQVLLSLCVIYIVFYLGRLAAYMRLRKLLRTSQYPILCEAYAIVIFDDSRLPRPLSSLKSAILYKETGSRAPRFFTGPVKRGFRYEFRQEQLVRVFLDRTNPKFYSVDDETSVSMASEKRAFDGLASDGGVSGGRFSKLRGPQD